MNTAQSLTFWKDALRLLYWVFFKPFALQDYINSLEPDLPKGYSLWQARKRWRGGALMDELAARGILIRSPSRRGVAEEAPGAYKDVTAVVDAAARAGLARKVARLEPIVCIKG